MAKPALKTMSVALVLSDCATEIRQFMLRRLGCPSLADDLFQDLTERVLSRVAELDVSNPRSYLFQAASNAIVDHKRAERTRNNYVVEQSQCEEYSLDSLSPERILISRQSVIELQIALSKLSPLSQKIFKLYRIEGLTQKQIAKQLGVSLSTVEKRIAKVFKHCRSHLSSVGAYDF
jgi:RNA polymerase sigma-19 factor, ECF subfamily